MGKYLKALADAKAQLLHIHDTIEESIREVHHYKKAFPKEIDYNIAMHGNVLVYYSDVRKWFMDMEFKSAAKMSDKVLWQWYRWYIGRAADRI